VAIRSVHFRRNGAIMVLAERCDSRQYTAGLVPMLARAKVPAVLEIVRAGLHDANGPTANLDAGAGTNWIVPSRAISWRVADQVGPYLKQHNLHFALTSLFVNIGQHAHTDTGTSSSNKPSRAEASKRNTVGERSTACRSVSNLSRSRPQKNSVPIVFFTATGSRRDSEA
jgi:hypothetical protein